MKGLENEVNAELQRYIAADEKGRQELWSKYQWERTYWGKVMLAVDAVTK